MLEIRVFLGRGRPSGSPLAAGRGEHAAQSSSRVACRCCAVVALCRRLKGASAFPLPPAPTRLPLPRGKSDSDWPSAQRRKTA
jgi:hypothetical protein